MSAVPTQHDDLASRAEAARYALLRRLAPAMRHELVVNLQPIGMIYEVLDRRLRQPRPDMSQVHASAQKIHGFARAALASCLDVVTWLSPDPTAVASVADGIGECAGLLATGLSFRGYQLRSDIGLPAGDVRQAAMRTVLTAALVQCTDAQPAPAELLLSTRATAVSLEVQLELRAGNGDGGIDVEPSYRTLQWADVEALAAEEGVALSREEARIVLGFPWARPAVA